MGPREKLLTKGVDKLTNYELVKVLIGSGNKYYKIDVIAEKVVKLISHGNVNTELLRNTKGLGDAKLCTLVAAFELAQRIALNKVDLKLSSPEKIASLLHIYSTKKQEHLVVVSVDAAKNLIKQRLISKGTLASTLIHPREVFHGAITDHAAGIFMVHNHPSGDLTPSREDVDVTQKIKSSGKILGIPLIDHIILSPRGYYSFEKANLL